MIKAALVPLVGTYGQDNIPIPHMGLCEIISEPKDRMLKIKTVSGQYFFVIVNDVKKFLTFESYDQFINEHTRIYNQSKELRKIIYKRHLDEMNDEFVKAFES